MELVLGAPHALVGSSLPRHAKVKPANNASGVESFQNSSFDIKNHIMKISYYDVLL